MQQDDSIIAVIPTWNSGEDLRSCLESLLLIEHSGMRFVIADNHSTENVEPIVEAFRKQFSNRNHSLEYVSLDDNYGPTGAINRALAMKYNGEAYILRIDSDIETNDTTVVKQLISFLKERPEIGIAGPRMKVPNVSTDIVATYWVRIPGTIINVIKDEPAEADMVNGGFVLIRGELYRKLPYLWSETLFYSWEELDLSIRAGQLGYKTFYYPNCTVIHKIRTLSYRTDKQIYYDFRNLLLVNWKYGSPLTRTINHFVLLLPRIVYWLIFRTKMRPMPLLRATKGFLFLRKQYIDEGT